MLLCGCTTFEQQHVQIHRQRSILGFLILPLCEGKASTTRFYHKIIGWNIFKQYVFQNFYPQNQT
jgi:hypothetical protein